MSVMSPLSVYSADSDFYDKGFSLKKSFTSGELLASIIQNLSPALLSHVEQRKIDAVPIADAPPAAAAIILPAAAAAGDVPAVAATPPAGDVPAVAAIVPPAAAAAGEVPAVAATPPAAAAAIVPPAAPAAGDVPAAATPPAATAGRPLDGLYRNIEAQICDSDPQVHVVYFTVGGSSYEELMQSITRNNPIGQGYHGYTVYKLVPTWPTPNGKPDFSQAGSYYEATIYLPKWTPPAGASPTLVAEWERYIQALAIHEKGHADIAKADAHIVGAQIRLEASERVRMSESDAYSIRDRIFASMNARQEHYDLHTNHGESQGARINSPLDIDIESK